VAHAPRCAHALVACCDAPFNPVDVNLKILEQFDCMLGKTILYDAPSHFDESSGPHAGRPYWRTTMTRAMLTTLLRSLRHGELSLGAGVSLDEAISTFEYEGITIGAAARSSARAGDDAPLPFAPPRTLRPPRDGLASERFFSKDVAGESPAEGIRATCERVAHAIILWPRLRLALETALSGGYGASSCSATRAWVSFSPKSPCFLSLTEGTYDLLPLVRDPPHWLQHALCGIGAIHYKLVKEAAIASRDDRSDDALAILVAAIERTPLGPFQYTALDLPTGVAPKRENVKGQRFAREMVAAIVPAKTTVLEMLGAQRTAVAVAVQPTSHGSACTNAPEPCDARRSLFAKTIVSIAVRVYLQAPNLSALYGDACADDGASYERAALGRALDARGVRVVRWARAGDASAAALGLSFPPLWAHDAKTRDERFQRRAEEAEDERCAVLLDFSSLAGILR
jgi:hypothetical protein